MARLTADHPSFFGAVQVRVNLDTDTSIKPYTVVEARIHRSDLPDKWILVGNHCDAWAFAGVDPASGTASMLELTLLLADLKQHGKRPRRTIIACSWDGEEYGLTGSTEWGEQFARDLKHRLFAYLNVDEAVAGAATTAGPDGLSFQPAAVAALAPMLVEVSRSVQARSGKTLYEAWRATAMRDKKATAFPPVPTLWRPESAAVRTTPSFSITSGALSSTWDSSATTACTTAAMTIISGRPASAIPVSATTRP